MPTMDRIASLTCMLAVALFGYHLQRPMYEVDSMNLCIQSLRCALPCTLPRSSKPTHRARTPDHNAQLDSLAVYTHASSLTLVLHSQSLLLPSSRALSPCRLTRCMDCGTTHPFTRPGCSKTRPQGGYVQTTGRTRWVAPSSRRRNTTGAYALRRREARREG